MASAADLVATFVGGRPSALFLFFAAVHTGAGLTCVTVGAIAALSKKRPGRHPKFGTVYFGGLAVVFVTATVMSLVRWSQDYDLFILGTIAFAAASVGYSARKIRWDGWPTYHIIGMGSSYIVLLTAFCVDNGPKLPLWDRLPTPAFWILPMALGAPIVIWALRRHPAVTNSTSSSKDRY
jgi:hypothetical protein